MSGDRDPRDPASRRFWCEQDSELRRLYGEYRSLAEIAHLLRRPYESVKTRVKRLALKRPRHTAAVAAPRLALVSAPSDRPRRKSLRKCLGPCGRMFKSAGAGNRICPDCALTNSGLSGGYDEASVSGALGSAAGGRGS